MCPAVSDSMWEQRLVRERYQSTGSDTPGKIGCVAFRQRPILEWVRVENLKTSKQARGCVYYLAGSKLSGWQGGGNIATRCKHRATPEDGLLRKDGIVPGATEEREKTARPVVCSDSSDFNRSLG